LDYVQVLLAEAMKALDGKKMDGQTPEANTMLQQQQQRQQQQANVSQNVQRQTWMQVVKDIRCRDVNKETCP
jgi:hypothetical protein